MDEGFGKGRKLIRTGKCSLLGENGRWKGRYKYDCPSPIHMLGNGKLDVIEHLFSLALPS